MKQFSAVLLGSVFIVTGFAIAAEAEAAQAKKNWATWAVGANANKLKQKPKNSTRVGYYSNGRLFGKWVKTSDKKLVRNTTGKKAGSIIIDTKKRRLTYTLAGGKALSYGIGVGRPGFQWAGYHKVSMKKEWPSWTPPASMLKRQPDLPRFMPGGPKNPLGARALYLGSSIYRIHGTNNHASIGKAVSSGCIRMHNNDVKDLYKKVKLGTPVYVF